MTTLFGRRRPIPELRASNYQTRSLGERLAVNTVMQGSAADIIKVAMIGIHRRLRDEGRRSRLVLQIHDELLFEAADGEVAALRALVAEEMTGAYPLDPRARGRRRRRRDLAGGEMTWTQISGTLSALPARRGEEPGTYLWIDAGEHGEHLVAELFLPAVASDSLDGALGVAIGSIRIGGDDRSGEVRLEFGRVRDGRGVVSARGVRCGLRHRLRAQPPSARGGLLPPLRLRARRRRGRGDHAARRRGDRDARRPLHSMRILTAAAMMAALVAAVSCEGQSASTAPQACSGLRRPGVPLAFAPAQAPSVARARCVGVQYAAVVGRLDWGDAAEGHAPRQIRTCSRGSSDRCCTRATAAAWPGSASTGCAHHHPTWIMHSPQGTEIHPGEHPDWVLLNFTNPKYQYAWALHVRHSLAAGGWTGVEVIDADNDPDWSDVADRPVHRPADDRGPPPPVPGPRARRSSAPR